MNQQLQEFARATLKDGLSRLSEREQLVFKRMYSHEDLTLDIDTVVNNMPSDRLDWAMRQVENSLKKWSSLDSWPCQQLHGGIGAGIRDNVDGLCTHPECHPSSF